MFRYWKLFLWKRLICKLVLECEDEILNKTETSFNSKKAACSKSNCLIYTISLAIICLLFLVVICVSCYFYYTNYRTKQKRLVSFKYTITKLGQIGYQKCIIKMEGNDKLKEIDIQICTCYYFDCII